LRAFHEEANLNDALRSAVRLATLAGAVALAAAPAFAQVTPAAGATPPDDTPSVKVGVTIYTDYTYIDEPTVKDADGNVIHSNAFNVGRAYVNVTGNLSHWVSFRVTPDVARESGNGSSLSGSLTYRLKYAFGQVNLDDFLPHGSWVRLGVQQTPYLDFMEGIYRYRFQGTMFPEREGFITSSDFGLTGHLNFGGNYGDIHAGVYNGEGYSKAEANDQKAFQVRGTLRPFPLGGVLKGLRLHAFYDADRYIKSGARNRFVGTATFEHAHLNAGVDYLEVKDRTSINSAEVRGNGWAVWAVPKFLTVAESKPGLEGLVRYDSMRPNKNVDARRHRLIVGLAYWFPFLRGPSAALLADMDRATFDTLLNKPTDRRYSLHALFAF
jgi:hypothetical protein